ncbi:MAG: SDR family oxidoreductase [Chlorobium phaeobacteroides]|uniref:NAD-dependent epimerase/dehydratase n=1 Tax=Chlorobium phaeobacteroides (strain BS1) TaxID=331678 RepID=B3EJF3_CHLPB|nr:SDR family oxidoreductase [Chlorobium phaeobacteroides]MBL6957161.1 SDR family oxidoreductase [Chlorobium phaeobacteroides]
MKKQKALIAGGSGYLGRYVAQEFKNRGYHVRVLVRNPEKIKTTGEHGEPIIHDLVDEVITGDATKPETLLGICDDIDIVFSSLGLTKPDFKHTSFDIDYRGNKRILDLAIKAKVKKFIYISVFNAEKMLDISNIQAHEQFAGELRKSGMEYTIIRPTGYFSDMLQFLNLAKMGIMPILGDGDKRSNPIHAADLAMVAADAAEGDERDIDAGGPDIFTYREVGELAASVTGTKPMLLSIPLWIGEGLLTVSRLINRDIADIFSFALAVSKLDSVAPQLGTHHLADFFKENL